MDIVEFLTARLDEDQVAAGKAQAVDPDPWTVQAVTASDTDQRQGYGAAVVVAADGAELWNPDNSNYGPGAQCMTAPTAQHIARHDPARVLAEVKAKRKLLEWCARVSVSDWSAYNEDRPLPDQIQDLATNAAIEMALRAMAAPYASHPNFKPKWAMR